MTDHKALAESLIARVERAEGMSKQVGVRNPTLEIAAAQVHATLYLAEQQRIANVIALGSGVFNSRDYEKVRAQIFEGLGLA